MRRIDSNRVRSRADHKYGKLLWLVVLATDCTVAVTDPPTEPSSTETAEGQGGAYHYSPDRGAEPNPCAPMRMFLSGTEVDVPVGCVPYWQDEGDPPPSERLGSERTNVKPY